MAQQPKAQQVTVLSKVIIHFRPEVHKTIGKSLEFTQVGLSQEGPFLKILKGPGSNIDGARMYLFEIIAGVETYASQIEVAGSMPPERKPN